MSEIVVLQSAEKDWFELYRRLGEPFDRAFSSTVQLIAMNPQIGPTWRIAPFRRRLITGYPVGIFYSLVGKRVVISAVIDLRQDASSIDVQLRRLQP